MRKPILRAGVVSAFLAAGALCSAETITWTNGAGDNQWNTPGNWDLNRVPDIGDDVLFNATSTDNAVLNGGTQDINSLTMASGFTGAVQLISVNMTIRESFLQEDGNVAGGNAQLFFDRDFTLAGGNQTATGARLWFSGKEDSTVDFGTSDWLVSSLFFRLDAGNTVTGTGTVRTASLVLSQQVGSTLTWSGSMTAVNSFSNTVFDSTLIVEDGGLIDARTAASWNVSGNSSVIEQGTGRILRPVRGVGFTDADGNVAETGDLYISLTDDDENVTGNAQDTTTVTVTSLTTGDVETITLTETNSTSADFRTENALVFGTGAANPGDGIIQRNGNEDLLVEYVDDQDPADTASGNLIRIPVVWDGGGADEDWGTAENWSTDRVPAQFDDVVFDGTSTKNCSYNERYLFFNDLTIEAAYTGTINLGPTSNNEIYEMGNLFQNGGTIISNSSQFNMNGSFIRTGGITNLSGFPRMAVRGPEMVEFDVGSDPFSIYILSAGSNSTDRADVRGDITITRQFRVDGGAAAYIHDTMTFDADGGLQVSTDGTFVVTDGAVVDMRGARDINQIGTIIQEGTGRVRWTASLLQFTDDAGDPVFAVPAGEGFFVTLEDQDENISQSPDTTTVTVTSLVTGDSETVTLTETDIRSEVFRNAAAFPTATGPANPGDGILQQNGAEDLVVAYQDDEDPDDFLEANLLRDPVIWDGGGADTSWFTAENWSTDEVPGVTDRVIFDATSSKDCDVGNTSVEVNSLTLEPGYTGTFSFTALVETRGDFIQRGGTIPDETGLIYTGGSFLLEGGQFLSTSKTARYVGSGVAVMDFGTPEKTFVNVGGFDGENGDLTVRGEVFVTSTQQFSLLNTQITIDGTMTLGAVPGLIIYGNGGGSSLIITDGSNLDLRQAIGDIRISGPLVEEGTGRVLRDASLLRFADAAGDPLDPAFNRDYYLAVTDEDENRDGTIRDTVEVTLTSMMTGDSETFVLEETGNQDGDFLSTQARRLSGGPAVPGNGILETAPGDTLTLSYTDANVPEDTLSIQRTVPEPFPEVWLID